MWHIDGGTACSDPASCERNDHDWPGKPHGWRADGSHPKHAPKESDMADRSEGEQQPHDDSPAAQLPHDPFQAYPYHTDGSRCLDWNSCDTNVHFSSQGLSEILGLRWWHEDGSECLNWAHCFDRAHVHTKDNKALIVEKLCECDETSYCQVCDPVRWARTADTFGDQPTFLKFEHEGPADMANVQRDGNVGELIDGRVDVYGDPVMGFTRHAQVWSGILGIEVQPWQVALCMLGYKLVRTGITPDYSDNSDDIEGYLDIFRQLMPDMVQARDTAEYLAGGGQGARA